MDASLRRAHLDAAEGFLSGVISGIHIPGS